MKTSSKRISAALLALIAVVCAGFLFLTTARAEQAEAGVLVHSFDGDADGALSGGELTDGLRGKALSKKLTVNPGGGQLVTIGMKNGPVLTRGDTVLGYWLYLSTGELPDGLTLVLDLYPAIDAPLKTYVSAKQLYDGGKPLRKGWNWLAYSFAADNSVTLNGVGVQLSDNRFPSGQTPLTANVGFYYNTIDGLEMRLDEMRAYSLQTDGPQDKNSLELRAAIARVENFGPGIDPKDLEEAQFSAKLERARGLLTDGSATQADYTSAAAALWPLKFDAVYHSLDAAGGVDGSITPNGLSGSCASYVFPATGVNNGGIVVKSGVTSGLTMEDTVMTFWLYVSDEAVNERESANFSIEINDKNKVYTLMGPYTQSGRRLQKGWNWMQYDLAALTLNGASLTAFDPQQVDLNAVSQIKIGFYNLDVPNFELRLDDVRLYRRTDDQGSVRALKSDLELRAAIARVENFGPGIDPKDLEEAQFSAKLERARGLLTDGNAAQADYTSAAAALWPLKFDAVYHSLDAAGGVDGTIISDGLSGACGSYVYPATGKNNGAVVVRNEVASGLSTGDGLLGFWLYLSDGAVLDSETAILTVELNDVYKVYTKLTAYRERGGGLKQGWNWLYYDFTDATLNKVKIEVFAAPAIDLNAVSQIKVGVNDNDVAGLEIRLDEVGLYRRQDAEGSVRVLKSDLELRAAIARARTLKPEGISPQDWQNADVAGKLAAGQTLLEKADAAQSEYDAAATGLWRLKFDAVYHALDSLEGVDGTILSDGLSGSCASYVFPATGKNNGAIVVKNAVSSGLSLEDTVMTFWLYVSDAAVNERESANFSIEINDRNKVYTLMGAYAQSGRRLRQGWNWMQYDLAALTLNGASLTAFDPQRVDLNAVSQIKIGFYELDIPNFEIRLDDVRLYRRTDDRGSVRALKSPLGLRQAVAAAEEREKGLTLTESWEGFQQAIAAAKAVLRDAGAEQSEYDAAQYSLTEYAFEMMDFSAIAALNRRYRDLERYDFTYDSDFEVFAALREEMVFLCTGESSKEYTAQQLTDLAEAYEAAFERLVPDFTPLEKAIARAGRLDGGEYTAESWKSLTEALEAAEAELERLDIVAAREACNALNTAIEALYPAQPKDIVVLEECDSPRNFHGSYFKERMSGAGALFFRSAEGQYASIPTKNVLPAKASGLTKAESAISFYLYIKDAQGFAQAAADKPQPYLVFSVASGANHDSLAARWDLYAMIGRGELVSGWNYVVLTFENAWQMTTDTGYANGKDVFFKDGVFDEHYGPDLDAIRHIKLDFGPLAEGNEVAMDRVALVRLGSEAAKAPRDVADGPVTGAALESGITIVTGEGRERLPEPGRDASLPEDKSQVLRAATVAAGVSGGAVFLCAGAIGVVLIAKARKRRL